MNTAAPQARTPTVAPTPAGRRGASSCHCAEGADSESPVAGLPRFLARHGASGASGPGCGVQPKLTVGRQDDPFEREADALADAVVRNEPLNLPGIPVPGIPGASGETPVVQRLCAECAAEAEAPLDDTLVQRSGSGDSSAAADAPEALPQAPDAGSPLHAGVRTRLESSLGADLGDVRVHAGPAADGMAKALNAKAFTHGEHIWLGPQQRADDLPLMAHEVAHVMQQGSGRARPEAVQRAPADYRHPEDGGGVLSRMQGKISAASEGHEDEQPTGDAAARAHSARSAAGGVDRGELAQERGQLEPQAKPSVDRPAQEAPKVEEAAAQTEQEADAPADPLVQADGQPAAGGKGGGKGAAGGLADGGAGQAQSAFGTATGIAMPAPETPVVAPAAVSAPTDAGGGALPADPAADAQVAGLAEQAQSLREQSGRIRSFATEERRNATTLRGNLALVRGGVMQAEMGVSKSREHLAFRQELLGQARQGLGVSEEKAATVAAEAPNFESKADEGKAESGPMATEASGLAAENAANTPDDAEAAANAREQGGAMNQAGSDIGTTDDAVTQTRAKAGTLGQDAAQAQQQNAVTQGRLEGMDQTLAATGDKLGTMGEQTGAARGEMEALASAPDEHTGQAAAIDDRGAALAETSNELESRLATVQGDYASGMAAVPAPEPWTREKVIELYGEEALGEEALGDEAAGDGTGATSDQPVAADDAAQAGEVEAQAAMAAGTAADADVETGAGAEVEAADAAPVDGGDQLVQRTPADSGEVETPPPPPSPPPQAAAGDGGAADGGAGGAGGAGAGDGAAADTGAAPEAEASAGAEALSTEGDAGTAGDAGGAADGGDGGATAAEGTGGGASDASGGADGGAVAAAAPAAPAAPERERVDAAGAVSGALPAWLTGVEPPNEEARQQAQQAADERRAAQIADIESQTEGGFAAMTATDRMGWALRQTGRNLFGSVGNIQWPGFGHLALGLIDPRGPMMGVVSGLGMMLSGGANLLSAEQWRRDPLGNLLKSAADIATGLTIVLGSITALAGVIIAIMTAITILSFGTAAPVTGPVIAFCTTVLTTVGGWTIAVGKVALVLQALVFIKNLIDAACAQTAAELQSEADQMTENVSDAGNVLMQMGMAKAGQLGGRAAASEIRAAGGGVRYAAQMGARAGVGGRAALGAAGRGVRALPAAAARGVRALPGALARGARAAPGAIGRGALATGRAIGRGAVATGRAIGRGTVAAGRGIARGTVAAGRAVGRGIGAAGRSVRALPGAIARGARALPGAVARGARALPGAVARGVRGLPGSVGRGIRGAASGAREYFGSRFSRSFIVGDDIANLGMARNASAEARAAVWAEARAPGGALASEARVAGAADDVHAPGAVDEAVPASTEAAEGAPRARADEPVPGSSDEAMPSNAESRARIDDTTPTTGAERDASVSRSSQLESDQITPREAANEVAFVDDHPSIVEGGPPNRRARIGDHEVVELPGGGCVRRSNGGLPIPCPDCFAGTEREVYDAFATRVAGQGKSMDEVLNRFGFTSEESRRALFDGVTGENDLIARLRAGPGGPPSAPVGPAGFGEPGAGGVSSRSASEFGPDVGDALDVRDRAIIPINRMGRASPSEALGADMAREGVPMPGPGHHAHHGTPFQQLAEEMEWLGERMAIDDLPQNTSGVGVWLPGTSSTPNVSGAVPHLSNIHAGQGVARDYAYTMTVRLFNRHGPEFTREYQAILEEMGNGTFRHMRAPTAWQPGMPPP